MSAGTEVTQAPRLPSRGRLSLPETQHTRSTQSPAYRRRSQQQPRYFKAALPHPKTRRNICTNTLRWEPPDGKRDPEAPPSATAEEKKLNSSPQHRPSGEGQPRRPPPLPPSPALPPARPAPAAWWCACRWTCSRSSAAPGRFSPRSPPREAPPWRRSCDHRPPRRSPPPSASRRPPGPSHIHRPTLRPRGAAARREEERKEQAGGGAAGTTDRHNHKHLPAASGPTAPNGVFFLLRHAPPGHAPRRRQWEGRERRRREATPPPLLVGGGNPPRGRGMAGGVPCAARLRLRRCRVGRWRGRGVPGVPCKSERWGTRGLPIDYLIQKYSVGRETKPTKPCEVRAHMWFMLKCLLEAFHLR